MVLVQFNANWEYEALSDHFIPRKSKPASPCLFSGTVVVNPASEKSGHLAGVWYHCIGFATKSGPLVKSHGLPSIWQTLSLILPSALQTPPDLYFPNVDGVS